jgi:hypothetical protein
MGWGSFEHDLFPRFAGPQSCSTLDLPAAQQRHILKFMSEENLSRSTKAVVAPAKPEGIAVRAGSHGVSVFLSGAGHDSGAEKVFRELARLSTWAGNPRGGGKC